MHIYNSWCAHGIGTATPISQLLRLALWGLHPMSRQSSIGMNALLDSVRVCVGAFGARMAVLESDPENPSFDNMDRIVNQVYFQFQLDLATSLNTVHFLQALCPPRGGDVSNSHDTEPALWTAYSHMDKMDTAVVSLCVYVHKLSFGTSEETHCVQRTLYECLRGLASELHILAGDMRVLLDAWLCALVTEEVKCVVQTATQKMVAEIVDKAMHAILCNHRSRDAIQVNLCALRMQTQITSDAVYIAELQAQTTSLLLDNSRLQALVATRSVYVVNQGDKPRAHRKKRAFKIDDVDCLEQRAPAS